MVNLSQLLPQNPSHNLISSCSWKRWEGHNMRNLQIYNLSYFGKINGELSLHYFNAKENSKLTLNNGFRFL